MTVDDEKLVKLFAALDPKQRKKAIKAALTGAGAQVRKAAVKNLKAIKRLNSSTGLTKGIRRINYKGKLGFRVTIGTKERGKGKNSAAYGYHQGRSYRRAVARGVNEDKLKSYEKPVLLWAEGGTKSRHTKTKSSRRGSRRKRRGHPTGSMPRYGFMERTKQEMTPKVDALLKNEINLNIQKIAKKYGCTIS